MDNPMNLLEFPNSIIEVFETDVPEPLSATSSNLPSLYCSRCHSVADFDVADLNEFNEFVNNELGHFLTDFTEEEQNTGTTRVLSS